MRGALRLRVPRRHGPQRPVSIHTQDPIYTPAIYSTPFTLAICSAILRCLQLAVTITLSTLSAKHPTAGTSVMPVGACAQVPGQVRHDPAGRPAVQPVAAAANNGRRRQSGAPRLQPGPATAGAGAPAGPDGNGKRRGRCRGARD